MIASEAGADATAAPAASQRSGIVQLSSQILGALLSAIFISYRRADSHSEARAIYERMARTYGAGNVFMDVEGIEHGATFPEVLKKRLEQATVLLAIIGPDWTGPSLSATSRFFDENDFVRLELLTALSRSISIIPVLVRQGKMPAKTRLPEDLYPILSQNAATVTRDNFSSDIANLDRQISRRVTPLRKKYAILTGVVAAIATMLVGSYLTSMSRHTSNTLVGIGDFATIPSPDPELEWLKIKIERNFVDFFGDNRVPVNHRSLSNPPTGQPTMHVNGLLARLSSQEVALQIRLERRGEPVKSVAQNASLELLKGTYKSVPAVVLYTTGTDPKTTKSLEIGKRITNNFAAALLYFEALRLAKAPELDKALAFADRAILADPVFATAYWAKAQVLRGLRRDQEALTAERLAANIDPDHPKPAIVGEPANPLPALFQRLQQTGWLRLDEGLLHKKVELDSYGLTLLAWSFSTDAYRLEVIASSSLQGSTAAELRRQGSAILAINGGFFDIDRESRLSPSGLVVTQGRVISPVSAHGGSGVIFVKDGNVGIEFAGTFNADGVWAAVQVGPLVVDPGGKNGIRGNDYNRQDRSAICLSNNGRLFVVVATGGLSLYELGDILSATEVNGGLGCERALNLDGGPSTQVSFQRESNVVDIPGRWKISNGVIVVRR